MCSSRRDTDVVYDVFNVGKLKCALKFGDVGKINWFFSEVVEYKNFNKIYIDKNF